MDILSRIGALSTSVQLNILARVDQRFAFPTHEQSEITHTHKIDAESFQLDEPFSPSSSNEFARSFARQMLRRLVSDGYSAVDGLLGAQVATALHRELEEMARKDGVMKHAGMGQGSSSWQKKNVRGDMIRWIHEEEGEGEKGKQDDGNDDNAANSPNLRFLVRVLAEFRQHVSDELQVPLDKSHLQLAWYPGRGSRYVRHSDVGKGGKHQLGNENEKSDGGSSSAAAVSVSDAATTSATQRRLTVVYYSNPAWNEHLGGSLRLYRQQSHIAVDIAPLMDRLVMFVSDTEHEVLPCFSSRFAVSGWMYGPSHVSMALESYRRAIDTEKKNEGNETKVAVEPVPLGGDKSQEKAEDAAATIFVSIASYRDRDCQHTIADLFHKAKDASRVFVGVCWQTIDSEDNDCFLVKPPFPDHVRQIRIDARQAKGPAYARHLAQTLWRGESHYLQIDAHMRFVKDWEVILLTMLRRCVPRHQAILTTYPMDFQPPDKLPPNPRPTILCASHFMPDSMLRLTGRLVIPHLTSPPLSLFWAAGFAFSTSDVVQRVPYDPYLQGIFFGEEMTMAARLWCHGFNFFAPDAPVVFHRWQRAGRPSFRDVMSEPSPDARRRVRIILGMESGEKEEEIEPQFHTLGLARSLTQYEEFSGVCHGMQTIQSFALSGGWDPLDLAARSTQATTQGGEGVTHVIADDDR